MGKMQTCLTYVLIIVGFFFISEFLSGKLIEQMYVKMNGNVQENFTYQGQDIALDVEVIDAKATNVNGYITVRVTNNTDVTVDKAYLKFDLFAKGDIKAVSRYMEVTDLKPGEHKDYTLKFRAGYVDTYKVAVKEDFPDEDYIFELFGYEFNTRNFLGMDISRFINAKAIKEAGFNGITSIFSFFGMVAHRFVVIAKTVPWWGYLGALAVIAGII
ncbi:MAG: hypothetical protein IJ629_05725 [Clostridia bacterium]|nr:hypothetical protein [Clostridia bacterium]